MDLVGIQRGIPYHLTNQTMEVQGQLGVSENIKEPVPELLTYDKELIPLLLFLNVPTLYWDGSS